jgi:MOSC domain-containing protein YiiM
VRVLSVNTGLPAPLTHAGRTVMTGIVKTPVAGRVAVGPMGLDGDGQADLSVHGGADKAVYAYPVEHYAHWEAVLGRDDLAPGRFGENLTVTGATEDEVSIGDLLRGGDALLEVSQPRLPCFKLGMRMGDPGFLKPFLASGRVGFYLRVREPGSIAAGDVLRHERRGEGSMTVREVAALMLDGAPAEELARGAGLAALPEDWRAMLARRAEAGLRRRPA